MKSPFTSVPIIIMSSLQQKIKGLLKGRKTNNKKTWYEETKLILKPNSHGRDFVIVRQEILNHCS